MDYTKSLCFDKLDLMRGMIRDCNLNKVEIEEIWNKLNVVSHEIDEYIDREGVRDRQSDEDYLNKCRRMRTGRTIGKLLR